MNHPGRYLTVLAVLMALCFLGALMFGSTFKTPAAVWQGLVQHDFDIWQYRLPRAILAVLVGAALALSGTIIQGIIHNPLASPDILSINHGASLAAVLTLMALPGTSVWMLPLAACVGAAVAFLVLLLVAGRHAGPLQTALIGVALSAFYAAITDYLMLTHPLEVNTAMVWLTGSLWGRTWSFVEGGAPLLVSTDQEGGDVQVLRGQGFSTIPSALKQSEQSAADLETAAAGWGGELAQAGVTMNLAPVADLVDIADPDSNEPIGAWGRQYGNDKETVIERAGAFARGMESAGVVATFKHFPGLGRVAGNTDTSASVTDSVTARTGDAAVEVFSRLIADGARVVMVSSAVYTLIDAGSPAVFSSVVVTDMLRGDLGFTGVVITDDVSAAAQVSTWGPAERAVLAVRAGCDIVLASGDPGVVEEMAQGLVDRARTDPAFAARVDESALRVLALKGVQS